MVKLIFRDEPTVYGYLWYTISENGNVFSWHTGEPVELTQKLDAFGYYIVSLTSEGITKPKRVHRLVALTFLLDSHSETHDTVNHKDGNKQNNNVSNLEWCTVSENNLHARDTGLNTSFTRRVLQLDDNGKILNVYESETIAAEKIGIGKNSISSVCRKLYGYRTAGGFYWVFEEDYDGKAPDKTNRRGKVVAQYALSGEHITTYNSLANAAIAVGCTSQAISCVLSGVQKTTRGFIFKLVEAEPIVAVDELENLTADWKVYSGLPKHKISRDGQIYSSICHRILKPVEKGGYLHLNDFLVHRLVAFCYIPNPNNYPIVNHKDGITLNNVVENLEWCTYSQNAQHAHDAGLNTTKKAVVRIDIRDESTTYYDSITNSAKAAGITRSTMSNRIKSGTIKDNYRWEFT